MTAKKPVPIKAIYAIFVEEPDDFYFHPRGVLFVDEKLHQSLFCSDVDHNFLINVFRKFPYADLEAGVEYKEFLFEAKNITVEMLDKFGTHPDAVPKVLNELYQTSPRQYLFLKKFLTDHATFGQIQQ